MESKNRNKRLLEGTQTPGIAILKNELFKSKILDSIDSKNIKHSGFKLSDIISIGIYKNLLNISTLTEASEYFRDSFESPININRTTISRNFNLIGKLDIHNSILKEQVDYILKRFNIKRKKILISIDETTIEVSPNTTYEDAKYVWDNAQKKTVYGYYVTIICISFDNIFLPVYFQLGQPEKIALIPIFEEIKELTGSNTVLFDGGYAYDDFYELLTEKKFIFYSKVPKSWIFNNGLNESIGKMRDNLKLDKDNFYQIIAYRVKDQKIITDIKYSLNFKGGDPRCIITNDLEVNSEKAFSEFKIRWDIETCNAELKENFCFEKMVTRNIHGITGFLLTSFMAFNLVSTVKYRFRKPLKSLFNKGFKKIIRLIIKAKATWCETKNSIKLIFKCRFKFKWIYKKYNLV